jgi:ABC-type transport system involved in multi-copper enzyme maturation permease subunit
MNILTRKLIAREFHQHRLIMVATTLIGLVALLVAMGGQMYFNIGMLTWLTAVVAFGVVLAMIGVGSERKERTLQFVLSLPLSHGEYVRTKLIGLTLCYLGPWAILTLAAVAAVLISPKVPDGLLPFTVLLCVFMLANYSVVLCAALHIVSEGWMTVVIIVTNMNITLFIFMIGAIPAVHDHLWDATPLWNGTALSILLAELATLAITMSLPYFVAARRRDFV